MQRISRIKRSRKNHLKFIFGKINLNVNLAGFLPLSVTFILYFYCFFAIQIVGIFQIFRVCFLMSFSVITYQLMSGRAEWFYWISGFFVMIFFSLDFFGEISSCIDWEAKKPEIQKKKFKFFSPEILKIHH